MVQEEQLEVITRPNCFGSLGCSTDDEICCWLCKPFAGLEACGPSIDDIREVSMTDKWTHLVEP
jgi:hypothetical protein